MNDRYLQAAVEAQHALQRIAMYGELSELDGENTTATSVQTGYTTKTLIWNNIHCFVYLLSLRLSFVIYDIEATSIDSNLVGFA